MQNVLKGEKQMILERVMGNESEISVEKIIETQETQAIKVSDEIAEKTVSEKAEVQDTKTRKVAEMQLPKESIWNEINKFTEQCKLNKQNYGYIVIEYCNNSTLTETKDGSSERECLSCQKAIEREFKSKEDTYGGYWGSSTIKAKEFRETVISFKEYEVRLPYKPDAKGYGLLTDIHSDNMKLFLSASARKYLEENNVNVDEVIKEFESIKSRQAEKEDIEHEERYEQIGKEIGECFRILKLLEEAIMSKAGIKEDYKNTPPVCPNEYTNCSIEELIKQRVETLKKNQELEQEDKNYLKVIRQEISIKDIHLHNQVHHSEQEQSANEIEPQQEHCKEPQIKSELQNTEQIPQNKESQNSKATEKQIKYLRTLCENDNSAKEFIENNIGKITKEQASAYIQQLISGKGLVEMKNC